jgi:hypothetical protein
MISGRFTDTFSLYLLENEILSGLRLKQLIPLCCIEPNCAYSQQMKIAISKQQEYESKQQEMLEEKYEYMIDFYNKIEIIKKDIVFKDAIKWYQEMKYHFSEKRKKWYQDMITYFSFSMRNKSKSFFISKWTQLYPEDIGKESQLEYEIMLSDNAMENINKHELKLCHVERYNHMMSIKIDPHDFLFLSDNDL